MIACGRHEVRTRSKTWDLSRCKSLHLSYFEHVSRSYETNPKKLHRMSHVINDVAAKRLARALTKEGTAIRLLDLRNNTIGPTGAAALAKVLMGRTDLLELNLQNNPLGDDGVASLADVIASNSSLIALDLAHTGFGQKGAAALGAALQGNSNLQRLFARHNAIGDAGCGDLAPGLRGNTGLAMLDLRVTKLGDSCAESFGHVLSSTSLRRLDLGSNAISANGAVALLSGGRGEYVGALSLGSQIPPMNNVGLEALLHTIEHQERFWALYFGKVSLSRPECERLADAYERSAKLLEVRFSSDAWPDLSFKEEDEDNIEEGQIEVLLDKIKGPGGEVPGTLARRLEEIKKAKQDMADRIYKAQQMAAKAMPMLEEEAGSKDEL